MRIQPNEAVKRSLIKRYWSKARRALAASRKQVIERAGTTDPDRLKVVLHELLDTAPLKSLYIDLWEETGGKFANDTEKAISGKKAADDKLKAWKDKYRTYAAQRSAAWSEAVMSTQEEAINDVISGVVEESLSQGYGIDKTRKILQDKLRSEMTVIENYQAERIARTEIIGASNKGSFDAATEMGLTDVKKQWLTSGLQGVRESHQRYMAEGPKDMKHQYNTGLKFPGDPECEDPGDVINCRCVLVYETE